METPGEAEDTLLANVIGSGSRKGSTFFGRVGDVVQRPPMWAVIATGLSATGERGRRAAVREALVTCRPLPPTYRSRRSWAGDIPAAPPATSSAPFASSFPSGHAASDLTFVFGAAQELPRAFVPLSAFSLAVHWSLIRKWAHYPSDVLAGGAPGIAVALGMWKLWPPGHDTNEETPLVPAGGGGERESGHYDVPDIGDPDSPRLLSDLGVTR